MQVGNGAADKYGTAARKSRLVQVAWAMHEWACQPYFTLIVTFLFAPYFAVHVVGDPAAGQASWGYVHAAAGLAVAICAPLLGAMSDAAGPRKPWILASALMAAAGCAMLWTATPGSAMAPIVIALVFAAVGIESLYVFANAMLPDIAADDRIGEISGMGIAFGQTAGVVALLLVLVAFALPGTTDLPLAPATPLLGLDPATFETERIVGPIAALWLLAFLLPLLLFVPDLRANGCRLPVAVKQGARKLMRTIAHARKEEDIALYLTARLTFYSGMNAAFLFGGVLAAGLFAWGLVELTLYGVLTSLFAALGALLGGAVDRRLGSRRTLIGALSLAAVTLCLMLSFDAGRMLFFWEPQAAGTSSVFATLPERVFLSCAAIFGALAGAVIATSRTLMAHLAPEDSLAEFFGLYASVGQATGFVAPLLVGALTAWSGSQRIGLSIAIPLIAAGAVMLVFVGDRRTSGEHRPRSAVAS